MRGKSERPHEFLPELFSGMEGRQIGLGHDHSLTAIRSSLGVYLGLADAGSMAAARMVKKL
jgi:hypothetical protein